RPETARNPAPDRRQAPCAMPAGARQRLRCPYLAWLPLGQNVPRNETQCQRRLVLTNCYTSRASELVALRWDDIDFQTGKLHVRRAKGGTASVHPIGGRELRALRRLKREAPASVYVFVSERLAPLSVAGYQRMVARAGEA